MDILPDDAPAPRLCHLIKWPDFDGYGFNLHAERSNPGQFIGKIDDDSPAQMAGLREGDRIVEVNGVNINNENHRQVVERIKSDPQETRLLVVDLDTDLWYRDQDLVVKSDQVNVVYMKTPVPRPKPDSPRANFHRQSEPYANGASLSPSTNGAGASSLETSDFNDDSFDQPPESKSDAVHHEPVMSPDSGKGDEEPLATGQPATVVIEAEINRQSPFKSPDLIISQQDSYVHSESPTNIDTEVHSNLKQEDTLNHYQANEVQPDSLSQAGSSMSPIPANMTQNKFEMSSKVSFGDEKTPAYPQSCFKMRL